MFDFYINKLILDFTFNDYKYLYNISLVNKEFNEIIQSKINKLYWMKINKIVGSKNGEIMKLMKYENKQHDGFQLINMPLLMKNLKFISPLLQTFTNLTWLYLDENIFSKKAILEFNKICKSLNKLEIITMRSCKLGAEGTVLLSNGLKQLPKLRGINLYNNNITDKGCKALVTALINKENFQELILWNNSITTKSVPSLKTLILSLKSLKIVWLYNNELNKKDRKQLIQCWTQAEKYPGIYF